MDFYKKDLSLENKNCLTDINGINNYEIASCTQVNESSNGIELPTSQG